MASCGNNESSTSSKRGFCQRCWKAACVCICKLVKGVVDNRIGVTILQHPAEKDNALGSARIALLGLQNAQVIAFPEIEFQQSCRIRPKIPGSKRCIAGRGGKKIPCSKAALEGEKVSRFGSKQQLVEYTEVHDAVFDEDGGHDNFQSKQNEEEYEVPSWIKLPHGACLLFPSEKALDLKLLDSNANANYDCGEKHPKHLIVLDGTWSKAKRLYYDNKWLHKLPHYCLPLEVPSLYACVRREPKPSCLSTIESIVYALKVLEPQTQDLGLLLEAFDSMICMQKRYRDEKAKIV